MSTPPRKILMFGLGSGGDVYPSIGIGRALHERGHEVELLANPLFGKSAREAGLAFTGMGEEDRFVDAMKDPALWNQKTGWRVLMAHTIKAIEPIYEQIQQRYEPGRTLVVAPFSAFGARIANEKMGVPLINLHIEPFVIRSLYHQPGRVVPDKEVPLLKRIRRPMLWAIDKWGLDPILAPGINEFRAKVGLAPLRRVVNGWYHSPDRGIGMFPDWYGRPKPDWPPQLKLTGFPMFDGDSSGVLAPEVEEFLAAGDPPIAFTLGTPMGLGNDFFRASAEACRLLGRRGMLLSPFADQMPKELPEGVRVFGYVPFGPLLPRCAMLVHHGGVGTIALALRAGIPQLVHPLNLSHPDNGARMVALGVGEMLKPKDYTPETAAGRIRHLLESPDVARQTRFYADKFRDQTWIEDTCRLIEEVPPRP